MPLITFAPAILVIVALNHFIICWNAGCPVRKAFGKFGLGAAVTFSDLIGHNMRGSHQQPSLQICLRTMTGTAGFEQTHKNITGNIFREVFITQAKTYEPVYIREVSVINSSDRLRIETL